ncbi:hypothetical protein H6P81_021490 [Aristolochia fimbriata]|uniref:Uncharacterized protein n=1 Tax=Aristolochia fimbriata TaxID=158543 RepID=A0AAV7DQU8_ARIFI|nr:hypothetical protein H6P81_021490 [Aristolochia fimbriata]
MWVFMERPTPVSRILHPKVSTLQISGAVSGRLGSGAGLADYASTVSGESYGSRAGRVWRATFSLFISVTATSGSLSGYGPACSDAGSGTSKGGSATGFGLPGRRRHLSSVRITGAKPHHSYYWGRKPEIEVDEGNKEVTPEGKEGEGLTENGSNDP